jgi:chemotaxis protein CheX
MLNEQDIRAFVYGTTRYFEVAVQQAASVGSPYLVTKGAPEVHEYSGVIAVSGRRNGIVYFSAPRAMLTVLLMKMNESNVSNEYLCDVVGEVANTIAGNVRRDLGKDFAISVPTVVSGAGSAVELPADTRPVVIPINWRTHVAKLVVCLK